MLHPHSSPVFLKEAYEDKFDRLLGELLRQLRERDSQ